jgi:hypothetical protein
VLAVGAVVSIGLFRVFSVSAIDFWDGWAVWGLHAHALYTDGTATGPVFTDPAYLGGHPEYPILYPALESLAAHAGGAFASGTILLIPAFFFVSGALALWAVLRTVIEPVLAAATATSLLGVPSLVESFRANYADGALALLITLAVVLMVIWLRSPSDSPLVLGSCLLGCSGLIKLDSVTFTVAAFIALAVAAHGCDKAAVRPVLRYFPIAVAPAVVWIGLVSLRGVHQSVYRLRVLIEPDALGRNWGRASLAASALVQELVHVWHSSLGLLLLACLLALVASRVWLALFLLTWLVLAVGGLVLLYVASTPPIVWHLGTSVTRVVLTPAIGVAVASLVVVTDAWDALRPVVWAGSTPLRSGSRRATGAPET